MDDPGVLADFLTFVRKSVHRLVLGVGHYFIVFIVTLFSAYILTYIYI